MLNAHDCIVLCNTMSREDFFAKIVCGVGRTREFSHAMCLGVSDLKGYEKKALCKQLQQAGLPADYSQRDRQIDYDLTDICQTISNRMIALT